MSVLPEKSLKEAVKEAYTKIAEGQAQGCCGSSGGAPECDATTLAKAIGYSEAELALVPDGVNLGLGCGNPTAVASLHDGEVVLDVGSGAGFDCFLAAEKVGPSGRVLGVDMTPAMIERARHNAERGGLTNVEFRLGELEALPVEDNSIDVVMSNCVINLVPDKRKVFREIARVLKPGGRMIVSDIVLTGELPPAIKESVEAYVGCVSGAAQLGDYLGFIEDAGLTGVKILSKRDAALALDSLDPERQKTFEALELRQRASGIVFSVTVEARKPR